MIVDPCPHCRGRGRIRSKRTLNVDIPAGVDDGHQLRLSAEGSVGANGGSPGDLYIKLTVRPHDVFMREGSDVLCRLPVNFAQAALGDELDVPSLDGRLRVKIPPGAQSGDVLRLRGKGIPHVNRRGRGDMLLTVEVLTPKHMDKHQRRLLEELAQVLPRPSPPEDR